MAPKIHKVCIDAGHGYKHYELDQKGERIPDENGGFKIKHELGATYIGFKEYEFSRKLAADIEKFAAPFNKYIEFNFTHKHFDAREEPFPNYVSSLQVRVDEGNKSDQFYAIHFDDRVSKREGLCVHHYGNKAGVTKCQDFAERVTEVLKGSHESSIITAPKPHPAMVLRLANAPAVLIECGDRTEPRLRTKEWRENLGRSIVRAAVEEAVRQGVEIPKEMVALLKMQQEDNFKIALSEPLRTPEMIAGHKDARDIPKKVAKAEPEKAPAAAAPKPETAKIDAPEKLPVPDKAAEPEKAAAVTNPVTPAKTEPQQIAEAVKTEAKKEEPKPALTKKDYAQASLPRLTITRVDKNGNIYAEQGGDTKSVATFQGKDKDKDGVKDEIYVGPKFRKYTDGKAVVSVTSEVKPKKKLAEVDISGLEQVLESLRASNVTLYNPTQSTAHINKQPSSPERTPA